MFEVSVQGSFSAAHRLRGYKGRCENMHGHNWKVQITIAAKRLNSQGMVIDFSRLKSCLNKILMHLDHKVLNNTQYFRKVNPTSENIARYIYDKLNIALGALNFKQLVVTVWETDTSFAAYSETR